MQQIDLVPWVLVLFQEQKRGRRSFSVSPQHAKKCISDSLGLVDFVTGLVDFRASEGFQGKFFKKLITLTYTDFWGQVKITFGLANPSEQQVCLWLCDHSECCQQFSKQSFFNLLVYNKSIYAYGVGVRTFVCYILM